jgi:hypothetical protein
MIEVARGQEQDGFPGRADESGQHVAEQPRGMPRVPRDDERHDAHIRPQELQERQLDFDRVLGAMRVVIHCHEPFRDLAHRLGGSGVHRHVAERRPKRARFPERDARFDCADAGVVRRKDDDETGDRGAGKDVSGRGTGVDIPGVRRHNGAERRGGCGAGANSSRVGKQRRNDGTQLGRVSGIETPRDSGCAD